MLSDKLTKNAHRQKGGFSLIELMVAMFIFVMVIAAMTSISVTVFRSYQKARAIKTIVEDVGYTLNSIAKDVRMGKIETTDSNCVGSVVSRKNCLMVSRNRGGKICYRISSDNKALEINENLTVSDSSCSIAGYKQIVDLSASGMVFDATSGFYGVATDNETVITPEKSRGWVEANLDIENPSMETDAIKVQTTVSSRDYGW